ncbi:hypothetical protein [Caulobacter sp. NIBR1757]|uniref:hypothetical protein n=1 Tax=Caulobacter sp. NIBR1757 TaxID=3016000 RepID=UPI0022F08BF3|nr:hypothetical protein [Caulobacter sp. NIBR1757]WGM38302.1 hypothetical protein AMEJIAPC_01204 [Caulobacter sp. NIBR1757]
MRRIIAALILLVFWVAGPASAATRIDDPKAFIAKAYADLSKGQTESGAGDEAVDPPDDIYTPALKKAFDDEDRDAAGDLGRLDFFFWVNGQDWRLSEVEVSERSVWRRPDRRVVAVSFRNFDQDNSLLFYFQKAGDRWLIDDVESLDVVEGEDGYAWVLSLILKYAREAE